MDSLATPAGVAAAVAAAGAVAVCTRCTLGGSGGVSSRAEQAVVGGLCGDAAAVTSHWCYDQEELAATIKKAGGEQNAPFIDPINAYYHVEPGQLSCCAPPPPPSYSYSYSCSCLPAALAPPWPGRFIPLMAPWHLSALTLRRRPGVRPAPLSRRQ